MPNEDHVASNILTLEEESDSDGELVSGSTQPHSVFNLAKLAHVMDKAYEFCAPSFTLPFNSMLII